MSTGTIGWRSSTGRYWGLPYNWRVEAKTMRMAGLWLRAASSMESCAAAVDVEIRERIDHRIEMARLPRQIEQIVLIANQLCDRVRIAHVGDVQPHAIADVRDVREIAAV